MWNGYNIWWENLKGRCTGRKILKWISDSECEWMTWIQLIHARVHWRTAVISFGGLTRRSFLFSSWVFLWKHPPPWSYNCYLVANKAASCINRSVLYSFNSYGPKLVRDPTTFKSILSSCFCKIRFTRNFISYVRLRLSSAVALLQVFLVQIVYAFYVFHAFYTSRLSHPPPLNNW
jgi:hypothetical protein